MWEDASKERSYDWERGWEEVGELGERDAIFSPSSLSLSQRFSHC
jgi:hypothetical protein